MVEEARRITIRDLLEKRKRRGKRAKRWAFRLRALGKQEASRIGRWGARMVTDGESREGKAGGYLRRSKCMYGG